MRLATSYSAIPYRTQPACHRTETLWPRGQPSLEWESGVELGRVSATTLVALRLIGVRQIEQTTVETPAGSDHGPLLE
jgi:hypothetical protein